MKRMENKAQKILKLVAEEYNNEKLWNYIVKNQLKIDF